MNKIEYFKGWNTKKHLNYFNPWNGYSNSFFNFSFGSFYENKVILKLLNENNKFSVIDVGCASGYLLRYLKNNIKSFEISNYYGVDLSKAAIDFAKKKYGSDNFEFLKNEDLKIEKDNLFNIVYSRDTILHQTKPIKFTEKLIELSRNFVLLRLRTRDIGVTEYDINYSCQMHYDKFWMPYIVININELIDFFKKNIFVKKIHINKSYIVLGGQNYRFLPKDLYFTKSGTAETTILLELDRENNNTNELIITESSELEGHNYLNKKRLTFLIYRILNKLRF